MMKLSLFRFSSNAKKKAYPIRIHAKLYHSRSEASDDVPPTRAAKSKAAAITHT